MLSWRSRLKNANTSVRALYGGVPVQIFERGRTLDDYGINAVWLGSGALTEERFALLKKHGARIFAGLQPYRSGA